MNNEDFFNYHMTWKRARTPEEVSQSEFTNYYRLENIRIRPIEYDYIDSYSGRYGAPPAYVKNEATAEITLKHQALTQLISDAELGRNMRRLQNQIDQRNPAVLDAWEQLQTVLALTR